MAAIGLTGLKTENMVNPLGLDTPTPRFSWRITATGKKPETGVVQTAYRIIVASNEEKLEAGEADLWDSGLVGSNAQLWIAYAGKPLKSNTHAWWKVQVKTNRGTTVWSEPQRFSTGLLGESHWGGRWIGLERFMPGETAGQHSRLAARYVRQEFVLRKGIRRATAFVAGLGLYEFYVNGIRQGSHVMTPAPSDYRKTIYYDTYDITSSVADTVAVGIVLGNGRYFAMRQDKPYKNATFGFPKCRVNMIVEYDDGTTQRLQTDEHWRICTDGPIRANNEYDGEEYDARCSLGPWTMPGYDDSAWLQAERTAIPTGTLRGRVMPSMVALPYAGEAPTATVLESGRTVYDFHQNMAGWLNIRPQGQKGDTIRIRYAERLNADGTLYTANLRDARSEDIYICSGTDQEWHPTFVTHGFRYAEISGPVSDVKAFTVSDEMGKNGHFMCSDTLLNKVVENACWGILSNYKGMPVDCPQRNERQPWLGDRTVGAQGEAFVFDNERLYTKWMRDIAEAQREDGCIPDVAPAFWNYYTDDVTWPAALPFICQMLQRYYGNDEALRLWRPAIERWLRHILGTYKSKEGLITKDKYGDWCMPPERLDLIHSQEPDRQTDGSLIATAYTIRCLQLMEAWHGLKNPDNPSCPDSQDCSFWHQQRQELTAAFNRKFLHVNMGSSPRPGHPYFPDSTFYDNNTVTANLLPLAFGICPDSLRTEVAKQVVQNIMVRNKGHVACGVIGISWLLKTLTDCGYADVAWLLATQRSYPSWGYMADNGATTIWELWNGDKADAAMNSANHVMLLGDLLPWCYETLGGCQPVETVSGRPTIVMKPSFDIEGCDWVDCVYDSPYGPVASKWQKTPQHGDWHVDIPCNVTAQVHLPDGTVKTVGSGSHHFAIDLPQRDKRIIKSEFVYTEAPFASCHASTIVETRRGDLVVAYFGGTYERNPDCNIWVNIRQKGSSQWNKPILAADGNGTACWNPVLCEMPDGQLWLFYKVGVNVAGWTGWLTKSDDGGRTWSAPEALPQGFLGPIKNKPLLLGNRLICGSSTEGHGWRFHVEILDLETGQWRYVGPVESTISVKTDDGEPHPIDCIQPSILQLSDGRLMVLMRTHNARLAQSFSSDGGETWTPVTLSPVENNQSGTDAVTLRDGRQVLIYNNFETLMHTKKGPRTPLSIAVSSDDGLTWQHLITLEGSAAGEYSYPAIIEGRDGTLHCTYTWQRKRVAYKQVRLK